MINMTEVVLIANMVCLATYFFSSLLSNVDLPGPWNLIDRFRAIAGVKYDAYNQPYGANRFAEMLLCPYCSSVWIGTAMSLLCGLSFFAGLSSYLALLLMPFAAAGFVYLFKDLKYG